MKKMFFAVLAFTTVSFSGAWAQDEAKNKTNREEMFKNMVSKQADKLAEDMKLDDSKAADFKKLFEEYKNKEVALKFSGKKAKNNAKKAKNNADNKEKGKRKKMTDAKADSLMTASFETQEKELQLRKEYYSKFKAQIGAANAYKVISPRPQMMFGPQGRSGNGRGGFGGGRDGRPGGNFGSPRDMGGDF